MTSTAMSMNEALNNGWRRVRSAWKLLIVYYLANLGIALVLAVPLLISLDHSLEGSAAEDRIRSGFDFDWFSQVQEKNKEWSGGLDLAMVGPGVFLRNYELLVTGGIVSLPPVLIGFAILYGLIQVFLSGGALSLFSKEGAGFKLIDLFRDSGFYFLRFVRILVVGLALLALGIMLVSPLMDFFRKVLNSAASESLVVIGGFCLNLTTGVLLAAWAMLCDYARIRMVQDGKSSALLSWLGSFYFVSRRPLKSTGIYLFMILAGAILAFAFSFLERSVPVDSGMFILLAFLLQQLYIAARIGMRLMLLSAQSSLFQKYRIQHMPLFPL